MKKLLSLPLALAAILCITSSAVPPSKSKTPKTTYGFSVQNGTAWGGTVSGYGAIYTASPVSFGTSGVYFIQYQTGASYITVTITCAASGSHTYGLTGGVSPAPAPVTTSSGTVTFTGVNVVPGDIFAYIH